MKHCVNSMNGVIKAIQHSHKRLCNLNKSLGVESDDDEEVQQGMRRVSKRLKNIPFYKNMKINFYYDSDKTESEDSHGSDEDYSNSTDSDGNSVVECGVVENTTEIDYLPDFKESRNVEFIKRAKMVAREFRFGLGDENSISRCTWDTSHFHGLISYVLCRILHGPNYRPTDRKAAPMSLVDGKLELIGNLQKYSQTTFGINPSEFNEIMNYDCFQWRSKFRNADWFYHEIHLYLPINHWTKSSPSTGTKKRNRPLDFTWYTKKLVKNEKISKK